MKAFCPPFILFSKLGNTPGTQKRVVGTCRAQRARGMTLLFCTRRRFVIILIRLGRAWVIVIVPIAAATWLMTSPRARCSCLQLVSVRLVLLAVRPSSCWTWTMLEANQAHFAHVLHFSHVNHLFQVVHFVHVLTLNYRKYR